MQSDQTQTTIVTVPIPETEKEARTLLERFENAARQIRGDSSVSDSVAQDVFTGNISPLQEQWLGNEDEELQAFVDFVNIFPC